MDLKCLVLVWISIPKSIIITFGFKLNDVSGPKTTDDHSFVAAVTYRKEQETDMGHSDGDVW